MKNIIVLSCGIGFFLILVGCNETTVSSKNEKNIGYFVTVFNQSVDYICANKRYPLNDNGKFECASFPISFYIESTKLGEINNIHEDGYVYPQDIMVLEEQTPIYTSDDTMGFLTID